MRPALAAAAFAVALALATASTAQVATEGQVVGLNFETKDLRFETADLVFSVEDLGGGVAKLGGGVENLQITETETEIKIELSGDVQWLEDRRQRRSRAGGPRFR